jgi:hypothetical protein
MSFLGGLAIDGAALVSSPGIGCRGMGYRKMLKTTFKRLKANALLLTNRQLDEIRSLSKNQA